MRSPNSARWRASHEGQGEMTAERLPYEPPTLRLIKPEEVTSAQRAFVAQAGRDAFLRAVHRDGYRNVRAWKRPDPKRWYSKNVSVANPGLVDSIVDQFITDHDIYFAPATQATEDRKDRSYLSLGALFADFDFKDTPEDQVRARLTAFLEPSAIVRSGNGLHVYWFLREPLDLRDGGYERAAAILDTLASSLGSDPKAKDPAHILRVPGTLNFKYTPPRPVELEVIGASYQLEEVLAKLPAVPDAPAPEAPVEHQLKVEERVTMAKKWLANQPPAIEGQGGDNRTYAVCCAVTKGHDLPEDLAFEVLKSWNARCGPPWDEHSLRDKIHRASRTPKGRRGEKLAEVARRLVVTWASEIKPRPVLWFWQDRLPLGALALLAGREGIGKTTVAYTLAADVTRGRLPGRCFGTPRSVIVAATEDSWEHTIVPRLTAAGADLTKVARVRVEVQTIGNLELSLPDDVAALGELIREVDCALVLLDPVISRLNRKIDTHKDSEVRLALEPLARLADSTDTCCLGIIHVNKGTSRDPLTMVMGSRAFVAVARAVLFVAQDPADEKVRLLGQPKNNLGRADLPTLSFQIENAKVGDTDEGPILTGKLRWTGESERTIREVLEETAEGDDKTALQEAKDWLDDYLTSQGGWAPSEEIKKAAKKAGHAERTLKRAKARLGIQSHSHDFPRRTLWAQRNAQVPSQLDLDGSGI